MRIKEEPLLKNDDVGRCKEVETGSLFVKNQTLYLMCAHAQIAVVEQEQDVVGWYNEYQKIHLYCTDR